MVEIMVETTNIWKTVSITLDETNKKENKPRNISISIKK